MPPPIAASKTSYIPSADSRHGRVVPSLACGREAHSPTWWAPVLLQHFVGGANKRSVGYAEVSATLSCSVICALMRAAANSWAI
jgi:hypothetical protein